MSKVLIIGAARTGAAAAKLLLNHGDDVVLTDNRETNAVVKEFPEAKDDLEELAKMGGERFETVFGSQFPAARVSEFDYILTSPGVPPTIPVIKEALAQGKDVVTDLEVAYNLSPADFVAITGTNGKTTTTTLTGEIFRDAGVKTEVVGNIGLPVSHYVEDSKKGDVFVTEISAFQLDGIRKFKPKGALVLNISPDHLDRYGVIENYIAAKKRISMNQGPEDFLILNQDDPVVREFAKDEPVRRLFISTEGALADDVSGAYYRDGELYIKDEEQIIPLISEEELGIKGIHNVQNALGAAALSYFYGLPIEKIRETLARFKGVEHRQEYITTKKGVRYINDSKGTNTNAAIIALNAMTTPVVLIAGGYDKHEDYTDFVEAMKGKVHTLVLLGQTKHDIEACAREHGFDNIVMCETFEEAVTRASEAARPGDTVLLSPACASWGMFDNYEVRGDEFRRLALELAD